ncbi:MAG: nucleoside hydrolase [Verrucomicrobia subdivision 3 bacterium]|nr:nucleoside hydrolase [Limisphaerales bacterium]
MYLPAFLQTSPSLGRRRARGVVGVIRLLGLWVCLVARALAEPPAPPPCIPLIYCTDLFHPYDDPDDHFDLATVFALPEFDIRCVILDQGDEQLKRPGHGAVAQLNRMTGRNVPAFGGLGAKLHAPHDPGLDQAEPFQAGVAAILDTLRRATNPVTIITVGSVRDLVAAFNREPELFRRKVGCVLAFIGEASQADFREWNVALDPHAYVGLMRSGLPLYWVPCFDGGAWQNAGHASFWRGKHDDLLHAASPQLLQYFIYALEKESAEPCGFLTQPVDDVRRARLLAGTRNLWCTAVFSALAGRDLVCEDRRYVAKPRPSGRAANPSLRNELFEFEPVTVRITDAAVVTYGPAPEARRIRRFTVRDPVNYARGMTEVTAGLLLPLGQMRPPPTRR